MVGRAHVGERELRRRGGRALGHQTREDQPLRRAPRAAGAAHGRHNHTLPATYKTHVQRSFLVINGILAVALVGQ